MTNNTKFPDAAFENDGTPMTKEKMDSVYSKSFLDWSDQFAARVKQDAKDTQAAKEKGATKG